ncbi:MAG: hypothetical protein AB7O96_03865 [Pseudobdellovibrionaceae bacterium]
MLAYISLLQSEMLSTCRSELLKTQKKSGKEIRQILHLNTQVQAHYAALRAAQSSYYSALASLNPYAIAAAKAHLMYVKSQGYALHLTQQLLIRQADFSLQAGIISAEMQIRANFKKFPALGESTLFHHLNLSNRTQKVAIESVSSRTPSEYRLKADFEAEQLQSISWSYFFMSSKSKWLNSFYKNSVPFSDQCAATLKVKNLSFRAFLKEDKWLSKQFSPF